MRKRVAARRTMCPRVVCRAAGVPSMSMVLASRHDAHAVLAGTPALRAMEEVQLDAVMAIEVAVYPFPWSRGNFADSLASGHAARVLLAPGGAMLGYFVAMSGVAEMHLLNITVARQAQGCGHARRLLDALFDLCRAQRASTLWLEVRESNAHARAVYSHLGFDEIGVRRRYYPAALGRREDAVVMSLKLEAGTGDGSAASAAGSAGLAGPRDALE